MAADFRFPHLVQAEAPLPPGAFDWIVLTTAAQTGPGESDVELASTAFVHLDRSTRLFAQYGAWSDTITQTQARTGRCGPISGRPATDAITGLLGDSELVYVHLGDDPSPDLDLAATLVDHVRARGRPVIVLGGTADQRDRLAHASGFIQGQPQRSLAHALALLHASHTATGAVHRLCCVDLDDLVQMAGDARQPSSMGEMLWRRDPFALLEGAPGDAALSDAGSAWLLPTAAGLRLAEITRLVGWLREAAHSPGLEVIRSAPVSLPCAASLPSSVGSAVWVFRQS